MPEQITDSKAVRLAKYLKEFVGLRHSTVRNLEKYEKVLWFHEMPREADCSSPAWNSGYEPGQPWLEVRKQKFSIPPAIPDQLRPWIDEQAVKKASDIVPALRETVFFPGIGEISAPVEEDLADNQEISKIYEQYIATWKRWADEYIRKERIQILYAELFRLYTQLQKQGEILELVLGVGLLDWSDQHIHRHIITARAELQFESGSGIIKLLPGAEGISLKIEDDMLEAEQRPARSSCEAVSQQIMAIGDCIWDLPSTHKLLETWNDSLNDGLSKYCADLKPDPTITENPIITFAPALILRRRNQQGMLRVYDEMEKHLQDSTTSIPFCWSALLNDEDDIDLEFSEREKSSASFESQEIFFPLAANHEQRRIVKAISSHRGVLVQGPPGTGKSHTIANLICHLLATGKRVLVTAETGRALQVLKDKLPDEIKPLCVSLLGQGSDSFAELNASVQGITTRQAYRDKEMLNRRISEIDQKLHDMRKGLAIIDSDLSSLRQKEIDNHNLMNGAYEGSASAIAERVSQERPDFGWLNVNYNADDERPCTTKEILKWLDVRRNHSSHSLGQYKLRIIPSQSLLSPMDFSSLVNREIEARNRLNSANELRQHPAFLPIINLKENHREALIERLNTLEKWRYGLVNNNEPWISSAVISCLSGKERALKEIYSQSQEIIGRVEQLISKIEDHSVVIPDGLNLRAVKSDAIDVIHLLENGAKWKSFGIFTPTALKDKTYLKDECLINGKGASTIKFLQILCDFVDIHLATLELNTLWIDLGGLPNGSTIKIKVAAIKEHLNKLKLAISYSDACLAVNQWFIRCQPSIPRPDWWDGQAQKWIAILEVSKVEEDARKASENFAMLLKELTVLGNMHDVHPIVGKIASSIEYRDVPSYSKHYDELLMFEKTKLDLEYCRQMEAKISRVVPNVLDDILTTLGDETWDQRLSNWETAWRWTVAEKWLKRRIDPRSQSTLLQRRKDTDTKIAKLLAESASLRAWKHFFNRLSTPEENALRGWAQCVQAIGRGTGQSAKIERIRREAREYMESCREAIPAWIMPRYLVAENILPRPGRYDVVIIDEASQLGIESLFLFYIAKKVIVVGDDQQISPYGIGIKEDAIASLQQQYIPDIRFKVALGAQSSIYTNAKIRFNQNIVLREHFRCMPEIIQFSNDLCYACNGTPLDPLRSFSGQRLAPLVVRHVREGYRMGSEQKVYNEPEADSIVDQIVACIKDPRYTKIENNRSIPLSMGVISLQGDNQAKLIEAKLLSRLDPETVVERRLICGDAYAFQGDERDVIFMSMVAAPNERIGTLSNDSAKQRFNVAASRARDQLWLFHSATLDDLSQNCMRHRLLQYMLNPTREINSPENLEFDSKFEKDIYQKISSRGYHVRTQVCVGDGLSHRYRIDLVVEGMQGKLAVECDGDKWHGLDRFEQDMARQRDLERAGWQFVRVRGGDFYRDQDSSLRPLWGELDRLGIKPGGIDCGTLEPPPPLHESESIPIDFSRLGNGSEQLDDHLNQTEDATSSCERNQETNIANLNAHQSVSITMPSFPPLPNLEVFEHEIKHPSNKKQNVMGLNTTSNHQRDGQPKNQAASPQMLPFDKPKERPKADVQCPNGPSSTMDDPISIVESLPASAWKSISHWAKENNKFSRRDRQFLYTMGELSISKRKISIKQAKWALDLYDKAIMLGWIPKD